MKHKINKLFSAMLVLMMIFSQSSNLIFTLYASTEIMSEQNSELTSEQSSETQIELEEAEVTSDASSEIINNEENTSVEIASDESSVNETSLQSVIDKTPRAYSDFSGVGNQNTSPLGKNTYITPNEAMEDALKDIGLMQSQNGTKYIAVDNLNANLIDAITAGEKTYEGVSMVQFPASMSTAERNAEIANRLSFTGSCWNNSTANKKSINTKIVPSDTCYYTMTDFGYYYNIKESVYEPVDLQIDVDFLDFYTSPADYASSSLSLGMTTSGVTIDQTHSDEFEFTMKYMKKDGTVINVPIFYEHLDFDAGISLGFKNEDLYKVATYYQNSNNPTFPASGTYPTPTVSGTNIVNGSIFNYVTYYDYVYDKYSRGLISLALLENGSKNYTYNRSGLNAISSLTTAGGVYTPAERGWNRLKILENGNYTTVVDSWGPNTGAFNNTTNNLNSMLISDGKDGRFAVHMNSSSTMSFNVNAAFLGVNPVTTLGPGQGSQMKPYTVSDTIITKSMAEGNTNSLAEIGEELTYTIQLDNVLQIDTVSNVPVRDSMLENLPSYLTWDGTLVVKDGAGNNVTYSGDIKAGTFKVSGVKPQDKVTITYKVKVNSYPASGEAIGNVATNQNINPKDLCTPQTQDPNCGATELAFEGRSKVNKSLSDSGDNILTKGETINYTITVTNPSTNPDYNVNVRDNLLENIPPFAVYNNDLNIEGGVFTGDILAGTLNFEQVNSGDVITITYSLTINDVPKDLSSLINVVTSDGQDPTTIDPDTCTDNDCSTASISVEPSETSIKKTMVDENGTNKLEVGDKLIYTIEVSNPTSNPAYDVLVRDSILENVPSYVTYNDDLKVTGSTFTGSSLAGTLTIDRAPEKATVTITYSLTVNDIPKGITSLVNIATDNDEDPSAIDPGTCDKDCSSATITAEEANTSLNKTMVDENGTNKLEVGDKLIYTIEVSNSTSNPAYDVVVRDSMLENLPSYVTYNNDLKVTGSTFTGNAANGTLSIDRVSGNQTVTVTYSLTVNDLPKGVTSLVNTATDNGDDPSTVDPGACDKDCSSATITAEQSNTLVAKTMVDENGTNKLEVGDKLIYTIEVSNPTANPAYDVLVRDSILENVPNYVSYNNDLKVTGSTFNGNATNGTLTIDRVNGKGSVTITYSLTVNDLPKGVTSLVNIATDNGEDPSKVDPSTCVADCASVTITAEQSETVIKKSQVDSDGNNALTVGETLTYTIEVSNPTANPAYDVLVRDSLLETLPSYVTYNNDLKVSGSTFSGSATTGTLTIDRVSGNEVVTITYSLKVNDLPKDFTSLTNIVTDNGEDPNQVDPNTCDKDCSSSTIVAEESDTVIKKSMIDSNENNQIAVGETLTYTIEVSNSTANPAYDISVRDSLLEDIPTYVSYNSDLKVEGSTYTGNVLEGTLSVDRIGGNQTVKITYSFTVNDIPRDFVSLKNVVTDNGEDPNKVDPSTCGKDCSSVEVTAEQADTYIEKAIVGDLETSLVTVGDTIFYTVKVTNPTANPAYNVVVRDSILENIPEYIKFNNDLKVDISSYTGDFSKGMITIDRIGGNQSIMMTYSVTITDLPKGITSFANIVTDNGDDPSTVDPETCGQDCSSAIANVLEADTVVKKSMNDSDGNNLLTVGETLTYTIEVTNITANPAYDISVRDSLLENLPSYVTYNKDLKVNGSTYSGTPLDGTLSVDRTIGNETVTITYSLTVNEIPKDFTSLTNIVTDNGEDPNTIDPELCGADCSSATINVEQAYTTVSKSMADSDGNNLLTVGETLTYTISVTNPTSNPAYDVVVRDSLLENLPSYITYNADLKIDGYDYSGDILNNTLTIEKINGSETATITYSLTVNQIPKDFTSLTNIVTDNGEDPSSVDLDSCSADCDQATINVEQAYTTVSKSLIDGDGNNLLATGETLTYTILVANPTSNPAYDVVVRDSLLENLPSYVTYNSDLKIAGYDYSGDILDNTLTISQINGNETATITYSLTVNDIPKDLSMLTNIVTDNGENPRDVDLASCDVDCSSATIYVEVSAVSIKKSMVESDANHVLTVGETLTYTLEVTNPTNNPVYDVVVRDSLLENLPSYITYNDDLEINGSKATGSISDGSLTLDRVSGAQVVTITYSLTVDDLPKNFISLVNIATSNGQDPSEIDPETCNTDCASATINAEEAVTTISKAMIESDSDNLLTVGETLTYTLTIVNPGNNPAYDVVVRDSLLENLPSYITYNDDLEVNNSKVTGSINDGTLTLERVNGNDQVTITYSLTVDDLPKDFTSLVNIATDNGQNPGVVDPETCNNDCANTTIDAKEATTSITKSMTESDANNVLTVGETLSYTLTVVNPGNNPAYDVVVRDSLLEQLPSYMTYNDDLTIVGSKTTGNIVDGTLNLERVNGNDQVTITYSLTVNDLPKDFTNLANIATNNGQDPSEIDPDNCDTDCSSVTIGAEEATTTITKSMVESDANNVLTVGETLTYTLSVTNPGDNPVYDVSVRDSLLEDLPSYVTFNDDVQVEGSKATGNIALGTLILERVNGKNQVTITYSLTVNDLPKDFKNLVNVATDNGQDPSTIDPENCGPECSSATITGETATTTITKSMTESDANNVLTVGETLTYTLSVTNPGDNPAYDVVVRDSLLEDLPSFVTYNDDLAIVGSKATGNIVDGTLNLDRVSGNEVVSITYSLTINDLPKDFTSLVNVATNNGQDPTAIDPETCGSDCSSATIGVEDAKTLIKKSMVDGDGDNLLTIGETLTYTLEVTNPTNNPAYDVIVRDSLLEDLPSYVTFNDDLTVVGSAVNGSMSEGTFNLERVFGNDVVTITYSLTVNEIPKDLTLLANIATDNGENPSLVSREHCITDCAFVDIVVQDADTVIKKSMIDSEDNNVLTVGETLNYTIEVANSNDNPAYDVAVRDSLLEMLPSYVTFNNDLKVVGAETNGNIVDGSFTLERVKGNDVVVITYSLTVNDLPKDFAGLTNIATDNGEDPQTINLDQCGVDCSSATIYSEVPELVISKTVIDEDNSNTASLGEKLTYTVSVANQTGAPMYDVEVRDSLLEKLPNWMEYNNELQVNGSAFTGDITLGTLRLDKVPAGETVEVTYVLTVNSLPSLASKVTNIAVSDDWDPNEVKQEQCTATSKCASATISFDKPEVILSTTGAKVVMIILSSSFILLILLYAKRLVKINL